MSYWFESGFRKNKYFNEKDWFKELGKAELEEEPFDKKPLESYEKGGIDDYIEKIGNSYRVKPTGKLTVKGVATLFYFIEEDSKKEVTYDNSLVREFYFVKPGARFELISKNENSDLNYVYREFFIGEEAKVDIKNSILNKEGFSEVIDIINLNGDRAEGKEKSAIYVEEGTVRSYTLLKHNAKSTIGDSDVRAVLRNQSKASIEGMIRIEPKGEKTDSYLHQYGILFEEAEGFAFPALEIENNDVRASHSASIKQISEEDIFYMESRGISKKEAEDLIIEGFLSL